jgi:hypothetical protein
MTMEDHSHFFDSAAPLVFRKNLLGPEVMSAYLAPTVQDLNL